MRYLAVLSLTALFAFPAEALRPEDIGATQYGTGYVAAAEKYRKKVTKYGNTHGWDETKIQKYYSELEKIFLVEFKNVPKTLKKTSLVEEERKTFFQMIAHLQEEDRLQKPTVIMIGKDQAVATDGHHRLRTMVYLTEVLEGGEKIWPGEVKHSLAHVNRLSPKGELISSLDLVDPIVLENFPKKAKASEIMQELLERRLGLWDDPKDDALAAKYYGPKKSHQASKKDLDYLASKLGITDGPDGIKFTPITELPDSSTRTLMGRYFDTRKIKKGAAFKDYVEFYVGDDLREIVKEKPGSYPNLEKVIDPKTSIKEQQRLMEAAMNELDYVYATKKSLREKTVSFAVSGDVKVEAALRKLKNSICSLAKPAKLKID